MNTTTRTPPRARTSSTDDLPKIVQPKIQTPKILNTPTPKHSSRKKKRILHKTQRLAEPEMFNFSPDRDTSDLLATLVEQISDVKKLFARHVPAKEERDKAVEAINQLTTICKTAPQEVASEIMAIIEKLKNDVSDSTQKMTDRTTRFLAYSAFSSACIYYALSPSNTRAVSVGVALGALMYYGDLSNNVKMITSVLTLLGCIGLKIFSDGESEPEETAQPEMLYSTLEDTITAITTFFAGYISFESGRNVPSELFKNFGSLGRVKTTMSDITKVIFETLESVYNWIRNNLFDLPSSRFFHTNSKKVEDFCSATSEVLELERLGNLYRTIENFTRIDTLIKVGEGLQLTIPRDKTTFGPLTLLNNAVLSLNKIKQDFERNDFSLSGGRQEAVGILLKGGPGTGKSVTMEHLNFALLAAVLGNEEFEVHKSRPSTFVYNRQFETKYWDAYTSQKVITMIDDFGQAKDISGNPDGEAMNMIRMGTSMEMDLHMAAVHLKGVSTFQSKFIIATTNLESFNFESVISTEAVMRRFDIQVYCVPKPQFCSNATKNLDLMSRRFDYSKLPKKAVDDSKSRYKPGSTDHTNLDPDSQDFYLVKKGITSGTPVSFEGLVEIILDCYKEKRLQHIQSLKNFDETTDKFRYKYASSEDLAPTEPIAAEIRERLDSGRHIPQVFKTYFEKLYPIAAKAESGNMGMNMEADITMQDIEDEGVFYDSCSSHEEIEPSQVPEIYPQATGWGRPHLYKSKNFVSTDSSVNEALLELKKNEKVEKPLTRSTTLITGYPAHVQTLVENMCTRYLLFSESNQRDIQRYIRTICADTYIEGLTVYKNIHFSVILAQLIIDKGSEFYLAFQTESLEEYQTNNWEPYHIAFESKPPINVYTDKAKELADRVRERYDETLRIVGENSLLTTLKCVLTNRGFYASIIAFGTALVSFKFIVRFFSRLFGRTQPESFGHSDKMKRNKNKNFYMSSKDLLAKINAQAIPEMGNSLDSSGMDLINSICKKNVYSVDTETHTGTNEFTRLGYVLAIRGRIVIMPYHFIKQMFACVEKEPVFLEAKVRLRKGTGERSAEYAFTIGDILRGHKTGVLQVQDSVLVELPQNFQPCKDRVENYAMRADYKTLHKNLPFIMYFLNKGQTPTFYGSTAHARDKPLGIAHNDLGEWTIRDCYTYDSCTDPGDCGAPFFVLNPALQTKKIYGMHIAGNAGLGESYSSAICQEDLLEDLKLFSDQIITEDGTEVATAECFTRVISEDQFNVLGKIHPAPSRNFKSMIVKSRLHSKWMPAKTRPALLRSRFDEDGNTIDPVANALKKYCYPAIWFKNDDLTEATNVVYANMRHVSNNTYRAELLTTRQAINGIADEITSHGISASTSAGYPMNVSSNENRKKWLFEHGREGPIFEERLKIIVQEVEEIERKYQKGVRPSWYFTDCLKDERRPHEKVLNGATRMFSGCPWNYLIIWRKYFGAFNLEFQANRIKNGMSVGVNPYSDEWHSLYKHLTCFDDRGSLVGAGDYSAFDGSEKPQIHYAILHMINRWYDDGEKNQKIREILWLEVVNSKHIIDGIVCEWTSSLPSGHPFTIVINCYYNHIAFVMCWKDLGLPIHEFYDHVYLCVCGDDNIFTVHPRFREIFNEITLCAPMKRLGLTYTTETKGVAVLPFRPIEDVEFLKRGFRYNRLTSKYVAPLRLDTVLEIPFWTKRNADRHAIAADNALEALNELSLHDEEIYDTWAPQIIESFREEYPNSQTKRPLDQSYLARQKDTSTLVRFF